MKTLVARTVLMSIGFLAGGMASLFPPISISQADEHEMYLTNPPTLTTTINAKAEFSVGAYVEVKYETSKAAATTPFSGAGQTLVSNAVMRVSSLPGETAVMTCNVQNGSAATRRDCTGSSRTVSYPVNGERRFGNDVDLGSGLMGGLDAREHNNIEINISYL
jgi:hypothetical protein